ncbi:uncharacterized protein FA14DRAFT_161766 [Meira miltonrushii]|uniref:Uncharacterized protein n=1 Tax=Meira miltonrushii TaxID=1280837 RepID=A0A316VA56_9BASI|nr:uncharacterized protein FA14DRAFT_161766 [Meira miltonrushii]PWN34342.1 hypothetical protein FA14DRAFT_161766 [Meira miltonrushii]
MQFATSMTVLLFLFAHVQCIPVKGIDLNRLPRPESPQEQPEERIPTKKELPANFIIKKRKDKNDPNSPAYKARMLANMTGHPRNSKEYKKVYDSHYFKLRKEQGSKFYEGMTKDPELSAKMHKEGQRRSTTRFNRALQERKRTGNMTSADRRYYEMSNKRARELYKKDPQACKERGRRFRLKVKALKERLKPVEKESKPVDESHANE